MNRLEIAIRMRPYTDSAANAFAMADDLLAYDQASRAQLIKVVYREDVHAVLEKKLDWEADISFWTWEQISVLLYRCGIEKITQSITFAAGQYVRAKNNQSSRRSGGKNLLLVPPLK